MTSIKLKFRAHTDSTKEGALYFQVIHDRVVKQVKIAKRAIILKEIKQIKELDLMDNLDIDYTRGMFLFSFYLCGTSFYRFDVSA